MAEYIEREAAIVAIKNLYPGIPLAKIRLQKWHDENKNFMECELTIERIPAADVVPVVRCKNCRHRDPEDHKCDSGQLERAGCVFPVDDDYFCAYGERPNCGARMDGDGDA